MSGSQGAGKEGLSIRTWKLALAFGLCALGVLVFVMLQLPSDRAGEPQMDAAYVDYAVFACSDCHTENWDGWNLTGHSEAWPDLMAVPAMFRDDTCEPCHSTGAGVPDIYPATGYDPATDLPLYLQNVTCQSCHGPAGHHANATTPVDARANISLVLNASLCGSCHYSDLGLGGPHHPTYNEWGYSGHNTSATLPGFVKQPSCSNCHEAWNAIQYLETGVDRTTSLREAGEDAPLTWSITCAVCHDPHSLGSGSYQLRWPASELCQKCHNSEGAQPGSAPHHPQAEVRNNTAGYGFTRGNLTFMSAIPCSGCHMADNAAQLPNHTFMPRAGACWSCHNDTSPLPLFSTVEDAQAYIDEVKSDTLHSIDVTQPLVEDAKAAIDQMAGNRTAENLVSWRNEYSISLFNLETVVSDKSSGNHNPDLAAVALLDARTRANAIVGNLTPPPKITGVTATDKGGGKLKVEWTASTVSDFAKYRIYVLSSSKANITGDQWAAEVTDKATVIYTVEDLELGTYYVYVTAVDSDGNEITNTLSGVAVTAEEKGGISTTTLAIVGAIIALVVIAVVAMLLMRKKKGTTPAETPEKPKE